MAQRVNQQSHPEYQTTADKTFYPFQEESA